MKDIIVQLVSFSSVKKIVGDEWEVQSKLKTMSSFSELMNLG